MKYESELIKEIVDTRGHEKSLLHYESECVEAWIDEAKGAYPKLTDYRGEWLNYIVENPIGEFPYITLSDVTDATVDNVVPYAYKSAILMGQTLVNLIKNPSDEKIVGMSGQTKAIYDYLYQLDTSKLYTLKFVVSDFNGSDGFNCSINNGNNHINDFVINGNGTYKVLTQSLSGAATQIWFYWNTNAWTDGNSAKVSDIVLIEGDYTNTDIPYFDGMQSVKMPVLTTVGKNLLEWQKLFTSELVDGYETNKGKFYVPVRIPVPNVNEQYTLVFSGKIDDFGSDSDFMKAFSVTVYYTDGTTSQKYAINDNTTITTIKGKIIDRIEISHPFGKTKPDYTARIKDIALYQGSVATPYEPYKSNILTVNEPVELRGIGDVKDELDCLRGELTQKVENVLLTGDEVIELWNTTSTEHLRFFIQYDGVKEASGICNKFINFQSQISANSNFESIACIKNGFTIVILKNRLNQENVDGFKQWVKDNSVSITYQLEQEVNKTVDLLITNQDGNTLSKIKPIEGTMHLATSSDTLKPTFSGEIPVEATTQNLASFIEE